MKKKTSESLTEEMNDLSLKVQMPTTDKIDLQVKQTIDSESKHLPVKISSKALHYSFLEIFC